MHITNVTLDEDYEDLYDDIWEALDCNNATTIDMEDWEMLLDGENQCGDELDSWFHFAFNAIVSVIQIVCQKYQIPDIFMQSFKESNTLSCECFAHCIKYILW